MSDDCNHGHNSASEESYFYKETARLIEDLRRVLSTAAAKDAERAARAIAPQSGARLAA